MQKIQKLFIALSVLISGVSQAQNAVDWLPSDVFGASALNLVNLKKDLQTSEFAEREFYKEFVDNFTSGYRGTKNQMIVSLLENPDTFNIDITKGLAGFVSMTEEIYFGGCFLGITNPEKIKNFVDSFAAEFNDTSVVFYSNQLNYFVSSSVTIAWNNEKVLIGGGISTSEFNHSREMYIGEDQLTWQEKRKLKTESYLKGAQLYLDQLFLQKDFKGLSSTSKFKKNKITQKDIWAWMDYGPIMQRYSSMMNTMMYYDAQPPATSTSTITELYKGTNYSFGFNFNESDLVIDAVMNQGDRIHDITKKVYKRKLNKKFFNYLPASTVGYVAIAANMEEAITASMELYKPMFAANPFLGERIRTGIELVQLALDEEAIGNIIKGDIILAVHELEVGPKKVIKFEMDEEYNYVETVTYEEELNAKFVIMATVGNEDNFNLILQAIGAFGGLQKTETNYKVAHDRFLMRTFGDMYVSLHDGIAFFSNDSSLIHETIPNGGYAKNNRIDKKLQSLTRKSIQTIVFDPAKLYEGLEKSGDLDSSEIVMFNHLKNTQTSLTAFTSKPKGQSISAQITINNSDSATTLGHVLNLITAYGDYEKARRARWSLQPAIGVAEAYDDYEVYEEEVPTYEAAEEATEMETGDYGEPAEAGEVEYEVEEAPVEEAK